MTRIGHFLKAKTEYGLHSPFVYRLYTEVLFSRSAGRRRTAGDAVWRLEEYYGLPHAEQPLVPEGYAQLETEEGTFLVVDRPHRDEAAWCSVVADGAWQVTLDLYTVGIAVRSPRLSKEHFLLR